MPTNEERRIVAEYLRESNKTEYTTAEIELCEIAACVGCNSLTKLKTRLEDLIEPEPERTCKMTKKGPEYVLSGWWACSECGVVYPPCNDDISAWALKYCPRCGAKVVEE